MNNYSEESKSSLIQQNNNNNDTMNFDFNTLESSWKIEENLNNSNSYINSKLPTRVTLFENFQIDNNNSNNDDITTTITSIVTNNKNDSRNDGISSNENINQMKMIETNNINQNFIDKFNNNSLIMKIKNNTKKAFDKLILIPIFHIFTTAQQNLQNSQRSLNSFPHESLTATTTSSSVRPLLNFQLNELFRRNSHTKQQIIMPSSNSRNFLSYDYDDKNNNEEKEEIENNKLNRNNSINKETIYQTFNSIRENFNNNVNAGFNISDNVIEKLKKKGLTKGININIDDHDNDDIDFDDGKDDEVGDDNENIMIMNNSNSRLLFSERTGIKILEIFGAIVGLVWGAFSHFQTLLTQGAGRNAGQ